MPAHLALCAFAILLSPWTLRPLLWPACYVTILLGSSAWETVKRRSACALLSGPSAAVMHTAWALGFFWGYVSLSEAPWSVDQARPIVLSPSSDTSQGMAT